MTVGADLRVCPRVGLVASDRQGKGEHTGSPLQDEIMGVFIALNGYDFEAPEDDLVEMVYGVAR